MTSTGSNGEGRRGSLATALLLAPTSFWYLLLLIVPLIILLALIVRAVAIEYRGKIDTDAWRRRWDRAIIVSAWIPSILWGVAFANLVRGVNLDADHQYSGTFADLLNPFALLGGAVTLTLFLSHGAIFLSLKSDGIVRERAQRLARTFSLAAIPVAAVWAVWAQLAYANAGWTWAVVALAAVSLVEVRRHDCPRLVGAPRVRSTESRPADRAVRARNDSP